MGKKNSNKLGKSVDGKRVISIVLAIIMVSFLAVMPVSAEVTELWSRSYDSGSHDYATGVATDANGNVIVTGYSWDGTMGLYDVPYHDYYTIKYDKDGTELWSRSIYNGGYDDYATGVATDANGNVIVTGYSSDGSSYDDMNYYTIKYDKDGTELWSRSYDGGYEDCANGVATDADGNVIVTGGSSDGSTGNYFGF